MSDDNKTTVTIWRGYTAMEVSPEVAEKLLSTGEYTEEAPPKLDAAYPSDAGDLTVQTLEPTGIFIFYGEDQKPLVTVEKDGNLIIHEHDRLNEAAKVFWKVVTDMGSPLARENAELRAEVEELTEDKLFLKEDLAKVRRHRMILVNQEEVLRDSAKSVAVERDELRDNLLKQVDRAVRAENLSKTRKEQLDKASRVAEKAEADAFKLQNEIDRLRSIVRIHDPVEEFPTCADCADYDGIKCCEPQPDDSRTMHYANSKPCNRGVRKA